MYLIITGIVNTFKLTIKIRKRRPSTYLDVLSSHDSGVQSIGWAQESAISHLDCFEIDHGCRTSVRGDHLVQVSSAWKCVGFMWANADDKVHRVIRRCSKCLKNLWQKFLFCSYRLDFYAIVYYGATSQSISFTLLLLLTAIYRVAIINCTQLLSFCTSRTVVQHNSCYVDTIPTNNHAQNNCCNSEQYD